MENIDILHAVTEADHAARQALADAERRYKLLQSGDILAAAEEKAMARAAKELEELRTEKNAETERTLAELDQASAAEREALEERYAAVMDACVETIFREAVGLS